MIRLFVFCATFLAVTHATAEEIISSHAIAKYGKPKYAEGFERFDYTSPKAKKGGEVKLAEIGSFDSLNMFIQKGEYAENIGLIYDSLMVSSADEPNTLYGLVAKRIEYPAESKNWVAFELNSDAKFADGHPIDAEDVKFTFETLINHGDPVYKMYFSDIGKVEVLNKHKIKFSISNPDNKDIIQTIAGLPVLPQHFWQGKDFEKSSLEVPLGSGAYKVDSVDAGRSVTYARDKNYWAKDLNVNRGMYNFDKIHVDYYRDQDIEFEAFKSGAFDYLYELTSKTWATGYDIPQVKSGQIKQLEFGDKAAKGVSGIFFNLRKPKFQNRALRQALGLALDFEWTNKNLFYGSYFRSNSFYQNTRYAASGKPSDAELDLLKPFKSQLPEPVFGLPYQPPVTDGSGNNRKQLREAAKILKDAGYSIKNGKVIDPSTNQPLEFEILLSQKGIEKVINPWVANLKKIGITANLKMVDMAQRSNRLQEFDYDVTWLSFRGIETPGDEQALLWGGKAADVKGGANYLGLKDPVVDALISKIIAAENDDQRIAATRALDRVMTHSHYTIPLYHSRTNRLAFWDKFSYPETRTSYDFRHAAGFYTWWIDDAKVKSLKVKKQ